MNWVQIPLGPLQTNAYVIKNDKKECVIIDPGSEGERFNQWLEEQSLKPLVILLTHAHFDHIGAVDDVRERWDIPVFLHKNEKEWLTDPSFNGSGRFGLAQAITANPADTLFEKEQSLEVGSFTFEVFETPGHSPGSVSFYLKEASVVFSGDTLFAGSIGRTDLHGGSHEQLLESIHSKLLVLPEETVLAPGHGQETTVQVEMDQNPFLNGF